MALRVLRACILVAGGAVALYLVAMNVFVRTRLFRSLISADPGSMMVDYTSAYSLFPGRIHVEGLRIRGRDSHVEWILTLDRCDFRFHVADFFHKRFHASDVEGDGLSLRARRRRPSFTAEEAAALPPVPGFPDPPYAGPKPPVLTDAEYNLWSVWLEHVTAEHVREVWIDTLRFTGDTRIRGDWYFKPIRWLEVGPAEVTMTSLALSHGEHETWVTGAHGDVEVRVHPGDVRDYDLGRGVLGYLSVRGVVVGLADGTPIAARVARGTGITVEHAASPFAAEVRVDHGYVGEGTRVWAGPITPWIRRGDLGVYATVWATAAAGDMGARADVSVRTAAVFEGTYRRAWGRSLEGRARAGPLDLASPSEGRVAFEVDATGLAAGSIRYWAELTRIAPRVALDSGPASLDAHVEGVVGQPRVAARGTFDVERMTVGAASGEARRFLATGDVHGDAVLAWNGDTRRLDLSGSSLSLRNASVHDGRATAEIEVATLVAERAALGPGGATGRLRLTAPDIRIPSVAAVTALLPMPAGVSLEGGTGHASLHATVDLDRGVAIGEATVTSTKVLVNVGGLSIPGDLRADLRATDGGTFTDLAGSHATFRTSRPDAWWARVDLPRASVAFPGLRLRATVEARAKDAAPVTRLLESRAGVLPKLALGLVPTSDLQARGEILLAPKLLEARSVVAHTDGLELDLELLTRGDDRTLALYAVAGVVHAGIGVEAGHTDVHLLGGASWFEQRRAAIRATEAPYER